MNKINKGSKVALQYRLTYDNSEGELIEEITGDELVEFTFGEEEMLEAFEEEIASKSEGDSFEFTLSPLKAYGPIQEELIVEYPKDQFLVEGELDEDFLQPGELIEMTDEAGNIFEGLIEENKLNTIQVNFNHPLAGEDLHFSGVVKKIS